MSQRQEGLGFGETDDECPLRNVEPIDHCLNLWKKKIDSVVAMSVCILREERFAELFCWLQGCGGGISIAGKWMVGPPSGVSHGERPEAVMSENTSTQSAERSAKATTLTGVLLRITWMFFGIPAFLFSGIYVFQQHGGYGVPDVVYIACIPVLLAVRYLDIRFNNGRTADFEPATVQHWVAYAWRLVLGASVFWLMAHVVGAAVAIPQS
jgi:hypothetical protein